MRAQIKAPPIVLLFSALLCSAAAGCAGPSGLESPIPVVKRVSPDLFAAFTIYNPSPSATLHNVLWYCQMSRLDTNRWVPILDLEQFQQGRQAGEIPPKGKERHVCNHAGPLEGTFDVSISLTFETTLDSDPKQIVKGHLDPPDLIWRIGPDGGRWLDKIDFPATARAIAAPKDAAFSGRIVVGGDSSTAKDPRTVEVLIVALKDPASNVRRDAAWALGETKDPRAVEPLIAALQDSFSGVRLNAALALGKIKDPRAIEPLYIALKDEDATVRLEAIGALGETPRAVEAQAAALHDADLRVRMSAARLLAENHDRHAANALLAALKERDTPVFAGAYRFFIQHDVRGREETFIEALYRFGDRQMALDFMDCGNSKLRRAGNAWLNNIPPV